MLVQQVKDSYLVILPVGTPLVAGLTQVVKEHSIQGGEVSGLGALKNVELGFYELAQKDYIRQLFADGDYELISLVGNITLRNKEPYVHVHASLGRSDFSVFGGHLFEATVAVTAEIHIRPLGALPERELDPVLGLQVITRCPAEAS